jgi:hypothetical protein
MDLKKLELLLDKYYKGNTTLEEEEALKKHYSSMTDTEDPEAMYFRYLNEASTKIPAGDSLDEKIIGLIREKEPVLRKKNVILKYWYLAASFVLLIGLGYAFRDVLIPGKSQIEIAGEDTFEDPQKAFEETKKALLMLSSNLNKGENFVAQFSKFEQSQKILKQN